jgi:pimeloyl-ACP methyl ester carboxylesterase
MRALLLAVALLVLSLPAQAAPRLPLHPCSAVGGKALCGTLRVPENRAVPGGHSIALKVVVFRARERPVAPDPVFWLAGGPGGVATTDAGWVLSILAGVTRYRDVVFVDQRGTGGSGRIACPPVPETVQDVEGLKAYVDACRLSLGADFSQYGTAAAMDDVDAVRAALGYRKINLVGGSYGVTAAQVFLNRHAGSVRSVVLDSGTLLEVPIFERWGSNAQRAPDQIAARCSADKACARAYPHWVADLRALIARLDAEPVRTELTGVPVTLDGATLANLVQGLSRSGAGSAALPRAVAHAVKGDYSMIANELLTPDDGDRLLVMVQSIMCNEPWAIWDRARTSKDLAGTYLERVYASDAATQALICSVFPRWHADPADWRNPRSNVPALILVGGADPQDPIGNIAAIRQGMPPARILVAPGHGHGVLANPCLSALANQFIARGAARGLDTGCVKRIAPPAFLID